MVKHTQLLGNLPTNCLSVFDLFVKLALKGLIPFHLKVPELNKFLTSLILLSENCSENIYLHEVNNKNIRKMYEMCSKSTKKTLDRCHWRCFSVFFLTLNRFHIFF